MKLFNIIVLVLLVGSLFFLPEADTDHLFLQAVNESVESWMTRFEEERDSPVTAVELLELDLRREGDKANALAVEREIRNALVLGTERIFLGSDGQAWSVIDDQLTPSPAPPARPEGAIGLRCTAEQVDDRARVAFSVNGKTATVEQEFYRWFAILPPFVAIVIALLLRRTILALFLGVWIGATLLSSGNPLTGLWLFFRKYFFEDALCEQFRLEIIGFVIALCAMVGMLSRGGGIQGFVKLLLRFARTVRSTLASTYLMGLSIFFDDYSNCILVGSVMRPLTDKLRISREKLSYVVDSTAAPVAGLSIISTWIAYEISTFSSQLPEAAARFPKEGISTNGYEIFFMTLPYRFYCIFTLFFILLIIMTKRDFGPMRKAERRARLTGQCVRPGGKPMVSDAMTRIKAKEGVPQLWQIAAFPVIVIVLVTMEEFWRLGGGWALPFSKIFSATAIGDVLGAIPEDKAASPIFHAALAGFGLALVLILSRRILSPRECLKAAAASTKGLFFAVVILFLAWCIGGVCSDIGTAHYLIATFLQVIPPEIFPLLLFITACLVSFSTGSSWSTMAILLPNTVLLSTQMGMECGLGAEQMLAISIGAVLEGSIFGDHCSPISDTTILSSVSAAADHLDHVKTQIPYAICTMSAAVLIGYVPAAMGTSAGWSLAGGAAALVAVVFILGRKTPESPSGC